MGGIPDASRGRTLPSRPVLQDGSLAARGRGRGRGDNARNETAGTGAPPDGAGRQGPPGDGRRGPRGFRPDGRRRARPGLLDHPDRHAAGSEHESDAHEDRPGADPPRALSRDGAEQHPGADDARGTPARRARSESAPAGNRSGTAAERRGGPEESRSREAAGRGRTRHVRRRGGARLGTVRAAPPAPPTRAPPPPACPPRTATPPSHARLRPRRVHGAGGSREAGAAGKAGAGGEAGADGAAGAGGTAERATRSRSRRRNR